MEINNQKSLNSLSQLQNLLAQISIHISKINEIIFEMNNILNNQINSPFINPFNNLMCRMNNFNNFNFNQNIPLFNKKVENIVNKDVLNVTFKSSHFQTNIIADSNITIKELLKKFFLRINQPELIDNYKDKLHLLFNGVKLDDSNEKPIIQIFESRNPSVTVLEKKIVIGS